MTMPETIWADQTATAYADNQPPLAILSAATYKFPNAAEYVLQSSVQAMIDAALATPPDPDTRVVSVEMLGLMIRTLNGVMRDGYSDNEPVGKVANALRTIIEGTAVQNDRKDDPIIDYPNVKVSSDYRGSDDQAKRVSGEIRAIIEGEDQ